MSRVCQVTGKRPLVVNNVSHANNKTKTRSLPNLQYKRFWVPSLGQWVRLRISAHGLRIINRRGVDAVVAQLKADGKL
ncbi:MAG: 50S ribosomal protein L28 [Proteobacteria bacterium]|nr:50S ribosomal protein L28 [Cystobacterineae bacterium]MCL2259148.1 50S ribosomal protein L28 [Cystobacterineae bacterium]MCL2314573.1 50S ribosomal protein L28 [Pseudomonadota bacterium]